MKDSFPFVKPPAEWKNSSAVEKQPGVRQWVERGPMMHFKHWMREVQKAHPGNLIPMQWIPEYVGVTRAAVKKRINAGKLTVFTFLVEAPESTMLGKMVYRETRRRFDFATISECDAWREQIINRQDEQEQEKLRRQDKKRIKKGV